MDRQTTPSKPAQHFADATFDKMAIIIPMRALPLKIDHILRQLDAASAARFERLVRDALDLVRPTVAPPRISQQRQEWLESLDRLRASVGTGTQESTTEAMMDDLRSDRDR